MPARSLAALVLLRVIDDKADRHSGQLTDTTKGKIPRTSCCSCGRGASVLGTSCIEGTVTLLAPGVATSLGGVARRHDDRRPRLYAGHRFPAEIISHAIWSHFRFPLGLRMVGEMLAAGGIIVSHETMRQSARKFGKAFANQFVVGYPAPRTSGISIWCSVPSARRGRTARRPACHSETAETWCTKGSWAGMSLPGSARTCPLASIAMASTPARVRQAVQKL